MEDSIQKLLLSTTTIYAVLIVLGFSYSNRYYKYFNITIGNYATFLEIVKKSVEGYIVSLIVIGAVVVLVESPTLWENLISCLISLFKIIPNWIGKLLVYIFIIGVSLIFITIAFSYFIASELGTLAATRIKKVFVSFRYEKNCVKSDDVNYYIGQTQSHLFFHRSKEGRTMAYPMSKIIEISFADSLISIDYTKESLPNDSSSVSDKNNTSVN